jgi:hypothetical protein
MVPKERKKGKKHKPVGIEAVVEPGVGSLYVRGTWMKKLDALGRRRRKDIRKSRGRPK